MENVTILRKPGDVAKNAASIIAAQVNRKKNSVLGLATGDTMIPLYKELVRLYKAGKVDFSKVKTFNLDEYAGLDADHSQSYAYYMNKNFFSKVNMKKQNINLLEGKPKDYKKMCRDYDRKISNLGIDLQVLGIGMNGHIGFNEPGSDFDSVTRKIKLSQKTLAINSKNFKSERIPGFAFTMGVGPIMSARKILLLATGKHKADAIRSAVEGRVNKQVPASVLQTHDSVSVLIDRAAAFKLRVEL